MKNKILALLKTHRNQFISGEEICRMLGVSRTAVWKHVQNLKDDGYVIQSQPRKGYSLVRIPDRLYPEEIKAGLSTTRLGGDIRYFERVHSTNNTAKALAGDGAVEGTVVVAEEQLGGRGRLGRSWYSPFGLGIWMSVILRPGVRPELASALPMVTAVAVARAVNTACGVTPEIKWPNDLLLGGKKLCGILAEMSSEPDRINYVVLGIGINTDLSEVTLPPDINRPVTSLAGETGTFVSRVKLVQQILRELEGCYDVWLADGFGPLLAEWKSFCSGLNREVTVVTLNGTYAGRAEDVDISGALLLRLPGGELKKVISGDIS